MCKTHVTIAKKEKGLTIVNVGYGREDDVKEQFSIKKGAISQNPGDTLLRKGEFLVIGED
jgi:hypothetical protein